MKFAPCARKIMVATFFAGIATTACIPNFWQKNKSNGTSTTKGTPASLDRCVALRGNGTHVLAHLTGLARITQEWGEVQAVAGGSSSTISSLLYESILLNPAVERLPAKERAAAVSLLLKSAPGYAAAAINSPEWKAINGLPELARNLLAKPEAIFDPPVTRELATKLKAMLENQDIRELVNPEIPANLGAAIASGDANEIRHQVSETRTAIDALTRLDANSADVFVREGVLNFPHFVEMTGRVADFYAGVDGKEEDFTKFIQMCALETRELLWDGIARFNTPAGNCGTMFETLVEQWRTARQNKPSTRLNETPGRRLPSILSTAVLRDEGAISALRTYQEAWRKGAPRQLNIPFDAVGFGYWVSPGFAGDPVQAVKASFPGLKSAKATHLGAARTWREILEKSPREPSLGSIVAFEPSEPSAGLVSLGGWADLHPVQILRAGGCKKIIYLTRRTDETSFITRGKPFATGRAPSGLAELLGMSASEYTQLYDLDDANSDFSRAIREADGVWCTNWNQFSATQQAEIAADSWAATLTAVEGNFNGWPMTNREKGPIRGCR